MEKRVRRLMCLGVAALIAGSTATAFAATKTFEGELTSTGGPVSFDAIKKDGKYRSVEMFSAGDESAAIPVTCEGLGEGQVYFPPNPESIPVKKGAFHYESETGITIDGEFKDLKRAKGTVEIHSQVDVGGGETVQCDTNQPEPWKAKRV